MLFKIQTLIDLSGNESSQFPPCTCLTSLFQLDEEKDQTCYVEQNFLKSELNIENIGVIIVIFVFHRETSPLQCVKKPGGYCFACHSSWNYIKTEVLILCDFFFSCKKAFFSPTFRHFH